LQLALRLCKRVKTPSFGSCFNCHVQWLEGTQEKRQWAAERRERGERDEVVSEGIGEKKEHTRSTKEEAATEQ